MQPIVPVLWFYGADAVGKSTVGWDAYSQLTARGVPAAYVDTDSLAFCSPQFDDQARLVELNLSAVWPHFAQAGARCLVVSGIMVTADHRARFAATIGGAELTVVRLDAEPDTLRARIVGRRRAEADTLGIELSDPVQAELRAYGERAVSFAALLRSADFADLVLDADTQSPTELAAAALAHRPWLEILHRAESTREPAVEE